MKKDERISCKITGVQPYGVFVEYGAYQGLVHISEVSDRYVKDIDKLFKVGEKIYVTILDIDEENKKLQLSYKAAQMIHPRVNKQVDIKIGFRSLEKKLDEWIDIKKEQGKKI